MKRSLILSVIFLSFLLASCTQPDSSLSPVGPSLDKSVETTLTSDNSFPFPLYTTFKSYTVKSMTPDGILGITVELTKDVPSGSIAFAVINYNGVEPASGLLVDKEMLFLDRQSGKRIVVPVESAKSIAKVTIYAGYGTTSSDVKIYRYGQRFRAFGVEAWKSESNSVVVAASYELAYASEVYAEVMFKEYSKLVFVQKPSSNVFSIPENKPDDIAAMNLFGAPVLLPTVSAE